MSEPTSAFSWAKDATYLCSCGASFAATRHVWVDADAQPALASSVRSAGPYQGVCPDCGAPAVGRGVFLEVRPERRQARLCIPSDRRGEVVEAFSWHMEQMQRRPEVVASFMFRPHPEFVAASLGDLRRAPTNHTGVGIPQAIGGDRRSTPPPREVEAELGACVGRLVLDGEVVRVEASLPGAVATLWEDAHLTVRPIHLRSFGYPLVGLRVVGSHTGQQGCIDAFVDVGKSPARDVFRVLSERFSARLFIHDEGGRSCDREVNENGLERNAALCLESAQAALAAGEYPPSAYAEAVESVADAPLEDRLRHGSPTLRGGAYQHLVGARETWLALEHLDKTSEREVLSRLLEEEGLPFSEYEEIRRRVLQASITFGLCAPRRFWRRIVASGMASDLEEYASTLSANRAAALSAQDDLGEDEQAVAWQRIQQLCELKHLAAPLELREALDLPDLVELVEEEDTRPNAAAGEIAAVTEDSAVRLQNLLQDPDSRLKAASELLGGRVDDRSLALVLDMLEELETEELLALLPDLSELGSRVTPGLVAKLRSPRREVRQAAVIVLGLSRATDALQALVDHLVWEPTTVWVDAARALGAFGARALPVLCDALDALSQKEQQSAVGRVSRAFAEVAVDTESGASGRAAVEELEDDEQRPLVATAAARALATLRDVSESGAQIRGELPLAEVTEVRGFSRRAYEAIMVPELEILEVEPEA